MNPAAMQNHAALDRLQTLLLIGVPLTIRELTRDLQLPAFGDARQRRPHANA